MDDVEACLVGEWGVGRRGNGLEPQRTYYTDRLLYRTLRRLNGLEYLGGNKLKGYP